MDEEIRKLERRVAAGDERARDELRRLRNRAGRVPWLADLVAETFPLPVPISRLASGVRAVLKAAGICPTRVRSIYNIPTGPALVVFAETAGDARRVATLFSLAKKAPVGQPTSVLLFVALRAADDGFDGPRLAPEHQDVFLEAIGWKKGAWEKERVAPVRFRRGDIVRVSARGRRNVVARVSGETLTVVPLSGSKGRIRLEVASSLVTLASDQDLRFEGPRAASLRRAYARLA